ncbi:MAG: ABC transporter ATP-binding protein [Actinomycetota bacterium]|nr:ABC transporter ATP-binding protein [Actinomycetota bacterium]
MRALELRGAGRHFAGVHAAQEVSLQIARGEVVGLVGPNGSGKTTVVNVASGAIAPTAGQVLVDGRDLTGQPSTHFSRAGVVRTFQALRLFEGLSVLDNVRLGAERAERRTLVGALVGRGDGTSLAPARAALDEVGMGGFADRPVGALSHGQRRRVELARAFAASPTYLVLDEPGAGVDPEQRVAFAEIIGRQRREGVGMLIVEHDPGLVERLADRVLGMAGGRIVAEGSWAEVSAHPQLAAQLGPGQ